MSHPDPALAALWAELDPSAPLAQRHLWLIDLLAWVRGEGRDTRGAVVRVKEVLDALDDNPTWQAAWQAWWRVFRQQVDITPLLADFGFAPRTAFLSELSHRLRHKLLPGTPETTDIGDLFGLLFSDPFDARWLRALDPLTQARLARWLCLPDLDSHVNPQPPGWTSTLVDAVTFASSQVGAAGFAPELRARMSPQALHQRPFQALPGALEQWRTAVQVHGRCSPQARASSDVLRQRLDACRHAAYSVYAHLQEHGISVGIVFRLRQLRERVLRIKLLLAMAQAPQPERPATALLADLVQLVRTKRSLRALIASSAQLTAAKVAEHSAETGEHYITRNAAEYRGMLLKAAGGGALVGGTVWSKFALASLGLTAFWSGLSAGMNYAFWFVLIQMLHCTLATKQPAVTAPAMVAKLRHIRERHAVNDFVDEVAHLLRSQIVAIVGNVGLVVPAVALLCVGLLWSGHAPMLDRAHALHVIHQHHALGPTALFAAFTGVLLFLSSLIAGWVDNGVIFHKLDSALAYNPRFTRVLGPARALRWAQGLRQHVSGLAANISLGLMLGLVPAFASFFGLGLEVRHVTLAAGQLMAAAMTLGTDVLLQRDFWWAVVGLLLIGPLNVAVSFYLAFRLALKARNVSAGQRGRITVALRDRLRHQPLGFVWPPAETPSPKEPHG